MYKKRGNYQTIEEYAKYKTGKDIHELNIYKHNYQIKGISEVADVLYMAAKKHWIIFIIGDYDADGLMSLSGCDRLFGAIHATYILRVPRRFSDGYGITVKEVDEAFNVGAKILITIDNGISGIEPIKKAREYGMFVIVLDHHMASIDDNNNTILPEANIIVDPAAFPEGNDFSDYCGAGLMYKLVEYMTQNDKYDDVFAQGYANIDTIEIKKDLIYKCAAYAAIATIADMVVLHEDNRLIVQKGLWALNCGKGSAAIQSLISTFNLSEHVSSSDIAFILSATINSPGRLYDSGGANVLRYMATNDQQIALQLSADIKQVNDLRKKEMNDAIDKIVVDNNGKLNFLVVDTNPGLIGLIAAKVQEKNKLPTFVCTKYDGIMKGSARCEDVTLNNIKKILDECKDLLQNYGGHAGAGGFSLSEENVPEFKKRLYSLDIKVSPNESYYDLEIDQNDAKNILALMDMIEPFGRGIERPIYKIHYNFSSDKADFWHGLKDDHIKFTFPCGLTAIAFGEKQNYLQAKTPKNIIFYGDLQWHYYRGQVTPQLLVKNMEYIN